jgi:dTMP kinase
VSVARFITFEGIDGAGKSTHLAWAAEFLRGQRLTVIVTREPGGTALGEALRDLLLNSRHAIHPETETLMMFAARRQHIEDVIRPALDRGDWVLCDRFTDASFAYQGAGRGVPADVLLGLERIVHPGFQPDLTFLFDVSPEVGRARVAKIKSPDRFERENADFFARVREGYLERMRRSAGRMIRIDAGDTIAAIQRELEKRLTSLWKK